MGVWMERKSVEQVVEVVGEKPGRGVDGMSNRVDLLGLTGADRRLTSGRWSRRRLVLFLTAA
jgi:hypothetical protein